MDLQFAPHNGQVICPTAGCNVPIGPAAVTFASPLQSVVFQNYQTPSLQPINAIQFTPAGEQQVFDNGPGSRFLLGTLTFVNGIWSTSELGFTLTSHSTPGSMHDGQVLTDVLKMRVTRNDFVNGTPEANADFIYFVGAPLMGSARAYELRDSPNNSVSVQVYGYFDSLHLAEFRDAQGGFIDPGIGLAPTPTAAVPEPGSALLASLALVCALGLTGRRRMAG